jgi:hypothetical protein
MLHPARPTQRISRREAEELERALHPLTCAKETSHITEAFSRENYWRAKGEQAIRDEMELEVAKWRDRHPDAVRRMKAGITRRGAA